jgi:hypothetical protein
MNSKVSSFRQKNKPSIPPNYQWSHIAKNHIPLDCPFEIYKDIGLVIAKQEGLIETIRRQYSNNRCIVGLSIGRQHMFLESLNTSTLYPKSNTIMYPNSLRNVYFLCERDGIHLLNKQETMAVLRGQPDVTTHRLLRQIEIQTIETMEQSYTRQTKAV